MKLQTIDPNTPIPFALTPTEPAEQPPARGMLLHCGAELVPRHQLNQVPTPRGTDTWYPLAHRALLEEVEDALTSRGFETGRQSHALSHDGARYFGVLEISAASDNHARDYSWVVGLRNSHDKSLPAGLVAGTSVLVCDNLCFSGEVRISRKHTRFAYRDLRQLTAKAVDGLGQRFQRLDRRIGVYRDQSVADWAAHDIAVRAIDCGAITASQLPKVIDEWREPSHREFRPRNLWSLFNAFTEVHKSQSPTVLVERGEALHRLFDGAAGLN